MKVTTSNGCIHLDQSYGIGLFDQGCEERCQCFPNGTVQCDTRCQPPLHPIGSTAGDKHCVEQKVPGGDECCVRGKITLGYKKSWKVQNYFINEKRFQNFVVCTIFKLFNTLQWREILLWKVHQLTSAVVTKYFFHENQTLPMH